MRVCYGQRAMATHFPERGAPLSGDDAARARRHRYLRPPEPVRFPESEEVPETNDNFERRVLLYQSLKLAVAGTATIGSDQFVYWDPTTAAKSLAPDVFVRLGTPHRTFRIWKTWQRGAPDLGVEIISHSDDGELDWEEKLARYRAAGVAEVVRFDPEDHARPIRVWDLIASDLVERSGDDPDLLRCEALGLWWAAEDHGDLGLTLRLARDRDGHDLLPTPDEQAKKARDAEANAQAEARKAHDEARKARDAEARAQAETSKARDAEARAQAENERLQAEMAALRAQLAAGKPPKPRRRRS
jgi:Uma2 family endonuclease